MLAHTGMRRSSFGSRTSRTRGIPRGGALTVMATTPVTLPAHVENTRNVRTWATRV